MKKTLTAIILAALVSQAVFTVPTFAAETHERAVAEFSRDQWNIPDERETVLLKTAVWNGKTALKKDTCYFVNKKIKLSRAVTLPEGSMLVIRSGGQLIVIKGGSLTVNGAVVVQSGAMLNAYDGGTVVIGESGAAVINGKLAVSKNGSVSSSGYIQGGDSAQINVKGTLSLSGELVSRVKPKIYSCAAVEGRDKIEVIDGNTRRRYYVEELSQYSGAMTCEYMGEEFDISDTKLKRRIADNIESVLYQYSGEITAPEFEGFDPVEYSMDFDFSNNPAFLVEDSDGSEVRVKSPEGIHAIYKIADTLDTIEGCFYSRIVGKDNPDIRAELGELRQSAMNS